MPLVSVCVSDKSYQITHMIGEINQCNVSSKLVVRFANRLVLHKQLGFSCLKYIDQIEPILYKCNNGGRNRPLWHVPSLDLIGWRWYTITHKTWHYSDVIISAMAFQITGSLDVVQAPALTISIHRINFHWMQMPVKSFWDFYVKLSMDYNLCLPKWRALNCPSLSWKNCEPTCKAVEICSDKIHEIRWGVVACVCDHVW